MDLTLAPADARCVVITAKPATGTTVVKQIPVAPEQPLVFSLSGLPTGVSLTLTEQVFTVACPVAATQTPTWASDPVTVTLKAGVPTDVDFTLAQVGAGGQINARSTLPTGVNAIVEFPAVDSVEGITAGPDDNLWFTSAISGIGRMNPDGGGMTIFPLPSGPFLPSVPTGITTGPDGNLWYTGDRAGRIGRVTPAGVITEFSLAVQNSGPTSIVTGRDRNLWFTESQTNVIGRITPAGVITEFPIPTANSFPRGITVGVDNNLWFTEVNGNKIARLTTGGVFTEFNLPTAVAGPQGIAAGSDGNLWFIESGVSRIGRITTSGTIAEFVMPTAGTLAGSIVGGPDGNLWFTETNGIGRMTPAGVVTEFALGAPGMPTLSSIAVGPDGNLWFTELLGGKVGRIRP